MKTTLNKYQFIEKFMNVRPNNFSYEGLDAMFEYLALYEEASVGEEMEFDPVGICCEFTEYDTFKDFQNDYQNPAIEDIEDLEEHTTVIGIPETERFIIHNF